MVLVMFASGKGDSKADHVWVKQYNTVLEANLAINDATNHGKYWVRGQVIDFSQQIDTYFDV